MFAFGTRFSRVALLALSALAIAACSDDGGNGDDGPIGLPPSIQISTGTPVVTVPQGVVGQLLVALTRTRFDGAVTLAVNGLPAGVTATVNPSPVTPGTNDVIISLVTTAAAIPGQYELLLRASATGVDERTLPVTLTVTAAPAYALTLAANTLTVVQGQAGAINVAVQRTNFNAPVTLAVTGLPAGVTATFSQNPAIDASGLTLAVAPNTAPGQYQLVVRGTTQELTERTANVALTVAQPQGFSIATGQGPIIVPAAIPQGGQANVQLGLVRTGGFAGNVTLSATSPQPGISATFAPATTNGNASTMTISVAQGQPTGIYTITIRGNATGLAEQTAPFQLQVTASGGGQGNTLWDFCSPAKLPLWFAYNDGGGAFVRVQPQGNQFRFNITTGRGGVAYVTRIGTGEDYELSLTYGTQAELAAMSAQVCAEGTPKKTITGAFVGVGAGQLASVSIGSAFTSNIGTGARLNFILDDVPEGTVDLVAARSNVTAGGTTLEKLIIRRNGNPADGATLPDLSFDGAEAFAPVTANVTISNLVGLPASITAMYVTANNGVSLLYGEGVTSAATTRPWLGVPQAKQTAGDLHYLVATVPGFHFGSRQSSRSAGILVKDASNQAVTLGGAFGTVDVTSIATAPYVRARLTTNIPAEYRRTAMVYYTQATAGRSVNVTFLSGVGNDGTLDTVLPDFSAVDGWNNAWGLKAGTATAWGLTASGWTATGGVGQTPFVEGGRTFTAMVSDNVIFTATPATAARMRR